MDLNETNITPEQSASRVRVFERHVWEIDYIAIEGHWFCEKTNDIDCDHGECVAYKIPELGITFFVYEHDDTRISIHRD